MSDPFQILAINPGSSSTKLAAYADDAPAWDIVVRHTDADLARFTGSILEQVDYRLAAIAEALEQHGAGHVEWSAVAGRGGLLRPLPSGTYQVDDAMLAELRAAPRGEHASNLGAFLARAIAEHSGCPAYVVDPVSVDELEDVARLSGLAGLDRDCLSHALNTKAVAKQFAAEQRCPYAQLRLIIVHLGSGISVSAHRDGRTVDVNNSREEGPFATERCGSLPALALVRRAIAERWTAADAERRLFREGGVYSYLGTRDIAQVIEQAETDARAQLVLAALLYQVRKEIGAMAAVLDGKVDAILLTGGMAHARGIVAPLSRAVSWLAPVHVYPGEDELRALALGALRVLRHLEPARLYTP